LLKPDAKERETSAIGLFRVDYSPAGSGHAVFIVSDLGTDSEVYVCYSDRNGIGEWIRENTIGTLPEFKHFDMKRINIKRGRFASMGNTLKSWTELVSTEDGEVRMTWSRLRAPFNLRVPIGAIESIPFEINTVIYPADYAEVTIDGRRLAGDVFPDMIGSQRSSTAFLALSETWYTRA
jgi:hypothetical protein